MSTTWKRTDGAVPLHVVQMIPIDRQGRLLVMHRGPNVRSARNVWSFPSGMHDIGEDILATASRELEEEYGLRVIASKTVGTYENIAGDKDATEHYHWVITVLLVVVDDVTRAINKEPDKHDAIEYPHWSCIVRDDHEALCTKYGFHRSFTLFMMRNRYEAARHAMSLMDTFGRVSARGLFARSAENCEREKICDETAEKSASKTPSNELQDTSLTV